MSFDVIKGRTVRIAGRNGSGKSTLIKQVLGLLPRNSNEVDSAIPIIIGKTVSYFPQSWSETIVTWLSPWENILLGLINAPRSFLDPKFGELILNFFPEFGINSDLLQNPTRLGVELKHCFSLLDVNRLSGGQQQKIVLLRTLAGRPKVLFLDEPYRDLDFASTNALNTYFTWLNENGVSLVYVSHQQVGIQPSATVDLDQI